MKTLILLFSVLFTTMSFAQVPSYVPANGLVGWWPFNGNANDESGSNHNLIPSGDASLSNDRNGLQQSAFSLSDVINNSRLEFNLQDYSLVDNFNQGSLSIWLKITSHDITNHYFGFDNMFMIRQKSGVNTQFYLGLLGGTMKLRMHLNGALPNSGDLTSNLSLSLNTWCNIVYTWDSSVEKIYINGVLDNSLNSSNSITALNSPDMFCFGSFGGVGGNSTNSILDDIGIWNRALTDCEIQNLYTSTNPTNTTAASACNSYTWNGQTYTQSGIYTGTTTDCVTQSLNLTITPSSTNTTSASACDSYSWNGQTYTQSGIYTGTTTDCVTQALNLTITPSSTNTTTATSCDSYTWNGTSYTASGVYTGTTANCVTESLNLTITAAPSASISYTSLSFCNTLTTPQSVILTGTPGGTYSSSPAGLYINFITGEITPNISLPGVYTVSYTLAAAGGCAAVSTTTLVTITIAPSASISYANASFCNTLINAQVVILLGTTGGSYSADPTGLNIIDPSTGAIIPSTSTAGTYTVSYTIAAAAGCSAVSTTASVTITPSSNNTTTANACGTYTWNGTTYTTSGVYTGTTTNCVTESLNLTITPSSTNTTTITACDSYVWNGTTYTTSGVYTGTTTNCVTESLNLTITPSSTNTTTATACNSLTWNGQTYTQSGVYTGSTTNCVTQALNLTINTSTSSSISQTALDSYTWPVNNQTYTTTGAYTAVIPNAAGCDSTITLNLTMSFTGINDLITSKLSIYPNPTNGDFTITGLELVGTVSSLILTDMNGKVVKVLDTKATKFSMASIKPGVYFLNIISGNKQEVLKIVKE